MADIVLLATADWDHPIWTNKQHVANSLANLGHRVLFVDSLGLRSPQPTSRDLRRILKRLLRGFRPPRMVRDHLWVWSPVVWPGGFSGFSLQVNRCILELGLRMCCLWVGFRKPCLWTYNPITTRLLNLSLFSIIVYHAVDAVQEQPCMPCSLIEREEESLCSRADYVFVTSPNLERRLRPFSRRIRFDPNVADYHHFSKALSLDPELIPSDLAAISGPIIGFVGAISQYKLDFALIASVARAHPRWQFVFIGPTGEGEPFTDTQQLQMQGNIHLLGPRPYSLLPQYCAGFDCGWLPLGISPYTQSMFPMKFFEYLSAGLPVVSTRIDALERFADVAFLVDPKPEAFSRALTAVLSGASPPLQERLAVAAANTYTSRTERMLAALAEDVGPL